MKELEILLNRRWILKSEDKELYYRVRDAVGEIRKYVTDKLGCQIIDNSLLIKLEKIPVIPEQFMGIGQFSSKEEYVYLCILLMFLEDKDAQEQFILSQLTEYMTAVMPGEITDWTLYNNRRKLIRVLRYTVEQGMVRVTDGTDDVFMDDEVDEDRGLARRHRVYKRLLFAPAVYREDGSGEDFEYLKYYGYRLSEELEQLFECHVQIHRGSAFLLSGQDCRMGAAFPENNSLADILMLAFGKIREKIEGKVWKITPEEMSLVDKIEFESLILDVKKEYGSGFAKLYRDMPEGEFIKNVTDEMERWMFIKKVDDMHQIKICPLVGKIQGSYPQDYTGGNENEQ